MTATPILPDANSLVELHQFLRQLVSVDEAAIRGEPDFARVEAYWHIGRIIVETEQQGQDRADYGVQLIEGLSRELTHHYGKGYKTSNLWWFRQFYLAFPILHALRGELTNLRQHLRTELAWTHYRILLAIDNQQERHFYLHNAADEGWSYRTLNRLIKSRYYYQVALGEDQLLATTLVPKKVSKTGMQRSRVAQARQTLLNQSGWALVSRVASGLPMSVLKPDVLFFHYRLHRFIGLWVSEATPALIEQIRHQLTEWKQHQPAETSSFPLALLLRSNNEIQFVLTSATPPLSDFETSLLPKSL